MQQAFQEWILLAVKVENLFHIKICREGIIWFEHVGGLAIADCQLQIAD